ncbi:putative nepenthesin [Helianthus annuus]|uniref:Nepenthesin n=1 Tax=Helianthus annuus TaxID=4232 RepID=A0A251VRX4_HELAN|nr:aspartic proteinase-like protein 2 isoform X1 [Helianthus annuus]KAF5823703.1 putative nepenthesin [Helianthus annuus]KAJ0628392.1 putative nepenthesin [Helianthus annuus]KAJ0949752.1 putative nepenthesin [Helianthus annuus]
MPVKTGGLLLILLLVAVTVVCDGGGEFPARVLTLARAFPANKTVELDILKARDRVRHARILQGFTGGVVDFNVFGTSDPYYGGLYFTKVKLGTPPKEFNVQIDTGSDILWVTCSSCSDCPDTSGFGMPLNFFDAASSSTASMVSCSDRICSSNIKIADASCSDGDQCSYEFNYADNSGTSGHYMTDLLHFDTVIDPSMIANSSAFITFGCSTYQSGGLTKSDKAMDGIIGFGQHGLSVISQLFAQGITPKVFSHCLRGDGNGGGKLVLGEILAPTMVYSPLVPSQLHYNLELQSIAVGEQLLPIDTSAFGTSYNQGTIVDTGTTLSYLTAQAYDPFVDAITAAVSQFATPVVSNDEQCYLVTSRNSVDMIFPEVSLNFAGGASMILKPEKYLMQGDPIFLQEGGVPWCIGFQKASNGVTVLGDLVLKDKIFVYDLSRNRMGWTDYDCSADVSIKSYNNEYVDGHLSACISLRFTSLEVLLVHILLWSLIW